MAKQDDKSKETRSKPTTEHGRVPGDGSRYRRSPKSDGPGKVVMGEVKKKLDQKLPPDDK